jgi:hypothetical protein
MSYLTDLIIRSCAIEREAFATLTNPLTGAAYNIDAFPGYFVTSEAFPYTTHRISAQPIGHEGGNQDEQFPAPRLTIRVVIGHLMTGYAFETDERIYIFIPTLVDYLAKRRWFQSAAYPTPLDELIYSEVVDAGGFMVFDNRGFAGVSQVGFEIQVVCTFTESIIQAYEE